MQKHRREFTFKSDLKPNEVGLCALGGLGEVGKNTTIIEVNNQIFIIDAGILFPDERILGVDYIIPNYSYLIENQDKIQALIITHGHEDHIGGIPFMLRQLKIPTIYAHGFAAGLIKKKMSEHKGVKYNLVDFDPDESIKFNNISFSFFRTNHSIPHSLGIIMKTEYGNIIHTGDFKIDLTPVGDKMEFQKLASVAKDGVLCLLSDSTSAEKPGFTKSEGTIAKSIDNIFSRAPKSRLILATFASNMYRVQQIIETAVKHGRKVATFGRSMNNNIEIGRQLGIIDVPKSTFIDPKEVNQYPPEKIVLLCTGSQGEPLAALSKIAAKEHKQIKLMPNDTVIFSSSPIPGNASSVNRIVNKLLKNGANVITDSDYEDTHTSGHGAQDELKMMINLCEPEHFMPVHGEHRMLKVHANLAVECGVKKDKTFVLSNGEFIAFGPEGARKAGRIRTGEVYVDGKGIGDTGKSIIDDRKILSADGVVSVIITIDKDEKKLPNPPTIVSRGFIYMKDNKEFASEIIKRTSGYLRNQLSKNKNVNYGEIKTTLTNILSKYIYETTDRKPMILPIIMTA